MAHDAYFQSFSMNFKNIYQQTNRDSLDRFQLRHHTTKGFTSGFVLKRPGEKRTLPCARVMAGGYRCLEHMIQTPDEVLIRSGSLL